MKLLVLLALCACAFAAAPTKVNVVNNQEVVPFDESASKIAESSERNSILINLLVRQLFAYIRHLINNGSGLFGFGPLDPLLIENLHLNLPTGLINLELDFENAEATGFGGFVVHKSNLNVRGLSFDIDISVPRIEISTKYALVGDLFSAIPLYGKGDATFVIENFRFRGLLRLKQSDDGKSVLLDKIEGASFELPHFESGLTGVIGGGDIDKVVNAVVEDVLIGYINRFQGVISLIASRAIVQLGNPILDQLDTWRFIAPFV